MRGQGPSKEELDEYLRLAQEKIRLWGNPEETFGDVFLKAMKMVNCPYDIKIRGKGSIQVGGAVVQAIYEGKVLTKPVKLKLLKVDLLQWMHATFQ